MAELLPSYAPEGLIRRAAEQVRARRYHEAEQLYRRAIESGAEPAAVHAELGKIFSELGRTEEAEQQYRCAIERNPHMAEAHYYLGNLLYRRDAVEAEECYRRAVQLKPAFAWAHANLGTLLGRRGLIEQEQRCYMEALRHLPELAAAHSNLGRTYRRQRRFDQAEACYRRALALKPGLAETHYELAELLASTQRGHEAEASYRRAIELQPAMAEGHSRLGRLLEGRGEVAAAEACYRAAIEHRPQHVGALHSLANNLLRQGRAAEAEDWFRNVLRLKPDSAYVLAGLGVTLGAQGAAREEEQCYRRAVGLNPNLVAAHSNLGNVLKRQGKVAEAEASYQQALLVYPGCAEAECNLGTLVQEQGRLEEAEDHFRRALEIKPGFALAYSNLLFSLSHSAEMDAESLFTQHRAFGERYESALPGPVQAHSNSREPYRRLTVGFVSGDLRKHPVTFFLEPLLAALSRCEGLAVHAFATHEVDDEVTARVMRHFAGWHPVAHLSNEVLAEKIREVGVDILVDLAGHTARNRLLTFARKPAPVQMSWLGYMGTTGLRAVDYFIADEILLPRDTFQSQFTEELIYLPVAAPFEPVAGAPQVAPLPALTNGYVTFGSFNRASKLTGRTMHLWARVLHAVPGARMAVGNLRSTHEAQRITQALVAEGITRERIVVYPACREEEYLALHSQVDACLDSLPYTGFTTTLQAMWMGVPTVTLPGNTPPSRQSTSVLAHTGLEAWIASDENDFVGKAAAAAADLESLARLRAGMRERLQSSPYRQPEQIAAALEEQLRRAWLRWCGAA